MQVNNSIRDTAQEGAERCTAGADLFNEVMAMIDARRKELGVEGAEQFSQFYVGFLSAAGGAMAAEVGVRATVGLFGAIAQIIPGVAKTREREGKSVKR